MSGVGFNGLGITKSQRKTPVPAPFSVSLQGLTNGVAENGTTLTFETTAGTFEGQRWQMTSTNNAWFDIAGAAAVTEAVDLVGGRHQDGALIRVGVTSGGIEVFSGPAPLVYAGPTVLVPTADIILNIASGIGYYDASIAFTGDDLTFELETMQGVSITSEAGMISFDTDQLELQTSTALHVTARNSGGFETMALSLTIAEASDFTVSAIDSEPLITIAEGALSIQIGNGPFVGTYDERVTDQANLTAAMIEAGATPLVLPTISGALELGSVLASTPGLWLYAGMHPGAPSYQWFRDGVAITGATGSSHLILTDDQDADLTVRETFGGVALESATVSIPAGSPFIPSDLTSYTDDFDAAAPGALELIGDKISAWENQGAGSNRFDMSNDSLRPSVLAGELNGLDVVRFEQNAYLLSTNSPAFGDDGTLMIVFRANAVTSAFQSLFASTGGTHTFQIDSGDTTGGAFFGRINSTAHTTLTNPNSTQNDWVIFVYRFDSSTGFASLWVDGTKVDEASDYSSYGTPTRLVMGTSRNLGAPLQHDAAQIWRFDAALSDAELMQMFTYAQTRWGIS